MQRVPYRDLVDICTPANESANDVCVALLTRHNQWCCTLRSRVLAQAHAATKSQFYNAGEARDLLFYRPPPPGPEAHLCCPRIYNRRPSGLCHIEKSVDNCKVAILAGYVQGSKSTIFRLAK
jgi:hypothetical protein